jgi:hypothetical protein
MNVVRKKLSALAMPQEIEFVPGLPKTRSLQDHVPGLPRPSKGAEIGGISTLENDRA